MGRIIFCAILIAGLCFGQFIKPEIPPCHTEPFLTQCHPELVSGSDIGQYVKPLSRWDRLTMFNLQAQAPQFFNTMLMMQVGNESLQPKTPFWKQAGIYGLEFVGGTIGVIPASFLAILYESADRPLTKEGYITMASVNFLFCGSTTWFTGKLLKQKGNWWDWCKASLGAGVGTITEIYLNNKFSDPGVYHFHWGSFYIAPSLGAVIGYNL